MSDDTEIKFYFIGWQKDEKTNTDKVWVAFEKRGGYYCGWGRRGKQLQFKQHPNKRSLEKKMQDKKYGGYDQVDPFMLFAVFPGFEEEADASLTYAVLANKVK